MEQFATEEQQVEAIKKFWKNNGLAIVVGAVLGLGGLYGWRYYQDAQYASQEQASSEYEQLLSKVETDEGYQQAQSFTQSTSEPGYAVLTAMQLAKQAVKKGELGQAARQLEFALNNADSTGIKAIAALRLARVQLQQQQLEQSLASLALIDDPAFSALVDEVKGDVYVQQKLFDKARAAYSAALEKATNNNLVKMKLDNLNVVANS